MPKFRIFITIEGRGECVIEADNEQAARAQFASGDWAFIGVSDDRYSIADITEESDDDE